MSSLRIFLWTVIALWALTSPLSAQSCAQFAQAIGKSPDDLVDGATFVRIGSTWRDLASLGDVGLSGPTTLQGVHVVKVSGLERVGVVVLKTGRVGPVLNASARRVSLVRRLYNECEPGVSVSSVSGEVYDGFHDFGRVNYDRGELMKLNRFHTAFGQDCKAGEDRQ